MPTTNLYVVINDSKNDPTFNHIDSTKIVRDDANADNPGAESADNPWCRVVPSTFTEAEQFAKLLGWTVRYENGIVVLVTDIPGALLPEKTSDEKRADAIAYFRRTYKDSTILYGEYAREYARRATWHHTGYELTEDEMKM